MDALDRGYIESAVQEAFFNDEDTLLAAIGAALDKRISLRDNRTAIERIRYEVVMGLT